ncbi:YdeI/OmpD-associated family protein [Gordonia humi]|uniref:Uncharacterized protein YdeI (YjbR/CyaY-like superfamily) n=1 Tax=Gordonia humi TaxID=686429 RepID=A0A840F983_9ACTN|nr:YdeI/OmpD-associated family protein [Gordonia humi]MBB4136720.1 uncharacterized protein YdeI (YjbR/CyaY-like superfamily) [Gordonia humi]
MTVEFTGQVEEINGRRLVRLPADASTELPSRGQVAATAVVNETRFETVVEPDGNRGHWIRLDGHAVDAGTTVTAALAPTKQWPEPTVPDDLRSALDAAPDIAGLWNEITPMARWEWVRWVQATKNAQTRARRVEVGVSKLRDGKRRPCCFDLSSCTDPDVARSGVLIGAK